MGGGGDEWGACITGSGFGMDLIRTTAEPDTAVHVVDPNVDYVGGEEW